MLGAAVFIAAAIGIAVVAAGRFHPGHIVHEGACFAHLAFLVVGFGAVLTVDWIALLWVLGRRDLLDVLRAAENVHVPIWVGYAGLVATGILLEPDLSSPLTQFKIALVLLIGWNGVGAMVLRRALSTGSGIRGYLLISGFSAAASQLGWWGAMLIGFLNGR